MAYFTHSLIAATSGTYYAFPVGRSLSEWTTYRVLLPEDNISAGRYNGSLDATVSKIWKIFSGASQPSAWDSAVETVDLTTRVLIEKLDDRETEVFIGGIPESVWSNFTGVSDGSSGNGRTFMVSAPGTRRIRQTGKLTRVKFKTGNSMGGVQVVQLRIFRGTSLTAQSEYFVMPDVTHTTVLWSLETPLDVVAGDYVGFYMSNSAAAAGIGANTEVGTSTEFGDGQVSLVANLSAGPLADTAVYVACYGPRPDLCLTGDSIPEGHNEGGYHGFLHSGVTMGGSTDAEIGYQVAQLMGGDYVYQNHALGSQTFAWVLSTGIPSAVAANPKAILIMCGVNDVAAGRTWAQVESDLDAIRLLVPRATKLFIGEILPYTSGTDANGLTIRTWNASLASWCESNAAVCIAMHDALGQVRVATGELDDLADEYDYDGVHLTVEGVKEVSRLIANALNYENGSASKLNIDGFDLQEAMRLALAVLAGKATATSTSFVSRAANDSKNRITATTTSDGDRTTITLNAK